MAKTAKQKALRDCKYCGHSGMMHQPQGCQVPSCHCSPKLALVTSRGTEDGELEELAWRHLIGGDTVISLCGAGYNRSGLLSALLVRRHQRLSGHDAIEFVRAHRPLSLSNPNFIGYLETLARPEQNIDLFKM